ncbi:Bardet-Biedl syndrome 2 protein [Perkinsus chesapeaki]|uniref:Bardet-Biedl syndrome 2 protein n=1 Tax=Perkinsus chesapeaki TaxID=330153 RepID=A0A7J6M4K9_PERCH|nr:Bardet-Biedl syndrome 2 protein [Perkinsus chesapeaki]
MSLALGTAQGKVVNGDIVFFARLDELSNVITALAAWPNSYDDGHGNDLLCIGTTSSLAAYDVNENSDLFYQDMPDGVASLCVAETLPGNSTAEGVKSIGYDRGGGEVFWTITGDRVLALAALRQSEECQHGDEPLLLMCGTEDYKIRVMAGETAVISDISEADAVCHLVSLNHRRRFAYGLANGTVGVYEGTKRLWRVRCRHAPSCLLALEAALAGTEHSHTYLAIGWMNGLVEVREQGDGKVIFKARVGPDPVAGLVSMDYVGSSVPLLLSINIEGRIHAWALHTSNDTTPEEPQENDEPQKAAEEGPPPLQAEDVPILDEVKPTTLASETAATHFDAKLITKPDGLVLCLTVQTGVIHKVILSADCGGIFPADGFVSSPDPPAKRLEIPLPISKPVEALIIIKCMTGVTKASREHTLLEGQLRLPRFAQYRYVGTTIDGQNAATPIGHVNLRVTSEFERVHLWLRESFLIDSDGIMTVPSGEAIQSAFIKCPESDIAEGLEISAKPDGSVTFYTDNIHLAADLVQHLSRYLNVTELDSSCRCVEVIMSFTECSFVSFPKTAEDIERIIAVVDDCSQVRQRMLTEMADLAQSVKQYLVRAEDLRLCDYTKKQREALSGAQQVSRGMIADYTKRRKNHEALLAALRELNLITNSGANLRVGKSQARVITACKQAIRERDAVALIGKLCGLMYGSVNLLDHQLCILMMAMMYPKCALMSDYADSSLAINAMGSRSIKPGCGIPTAKLYPGSIVSESTDLWIPPRFHEWHTARATRRSIYLAWDAASHPFDQVHGYELQVRNPVPSSMSSVDDLTTRLREAQLLHRRDVVDEVCEGCPYEFRIRAIGLREGDSPWSLKTLVAHTIRPGLVERVPFEIIGSGRNNAGPGSFVVNGEVIFRRTTERGLLLVTLARQNLKLVHMRMYDTFTDKTASNRMASDLKKFGSDVFVIVLSIDAWEWHATPGLAKAMEFCGAYHFGIWSRVFADHLHQPSPVADFEESASQINFGHPYAFVGIPGIGTGMGWESLQYNTGHYLAKVGRSPRAIIRGLFYLDYFTMRYRLSDVVTNTANYYLKGQPPRPETLHNPLPIEKQVKPDYYVDIPDPYTPYVGNLWNSVELLLTSNETIHLPQYNLTNYGFQIVLDLFLGDPLNYIDARLSISVEDTYFQMPELERVWGGPSDRIDVARTALSGEVVPLWRGSNRTVNRSEVVMVLEDRVCGDPAVNYITKWRYNASNNICRGSPFDISPSQADLVSDAPLMSSNRTTWMDPVNTAKSLIHRNFTQIGNGTCCPDYDVDPNGSPMMAFGVGIWPTICHSSNCVNYHVEARQRNINGTWSERHYWNFAMFNQLNDETIDATLRHLEVTSN